eukprot:10084097-Alexandrium_andersonii.AAC.1
MPLMPLERLSIRLPRPQASRPVRRSGSRRRAQWVSRPPARPRPFRTPPERDIERKRFDRGQASRAHAMTRDEFWDLSA